MLLFLTALVFALIGLALGGGGLWLIVLGGSWYYLLAGLGFLVTAYLLWRGRAAALGVYAAVTLGTLVWAVWEVGFDWWQLGPRGGVIIILGLWLLLPAIRRRLGFTSPTGQDYKAGALPLGLAVLASILVAGYSMTQDPLDLSGELPAAASAAAPDLGGNVPEGDWHQYGRTGYGQRYSPLAQITTENVEKLEVAWQYQTGDVKLPEDVGETTYQVTPLKVRDTLYLCTPHNWAIALDAATGKEKWKFDSNSGMNPDRQHQTCRGV
ncbi:MAG TPA: membrane-bound PQQ-dependent dehydrogenase, glucose/quinate/shikimate family, partial [Nordella sp.]|nr:membrane-bound PQQ-dependent dehydrogenase, glucose/quinate/shikimate family [Nordella sp.]